MKIESIKNFYPTSYKGIKKESSIPKTLSSEKPITSSLDSTSIIGQAQVLLQNKQTPEEKLLKKILDNDSMGFKLIEENWESNVYRIYQKGNEEAPISFANVYSDENDNIECVYLFDMKSENIFIYDENGEFQRQITTDDISGAYAYKYNSFYFHSRLRGEKQEENNEYLTQLNKLFANKNKLDKAKEDMVVYRAHQLTPEQMGEVGDIYQDKSFLSTSENEGIAEHFHSHDMSHAFLTINVPKDSTFLYLDRLFNIKKKRSRENEILFDKGTKFLIEDIDNITKEVTLTLIPD